MTRTSMRETGQWPVTCHLLTFLPRPARQSNTPAPRAVTTHISHNTALPIALRPRALDFSTDSVAWTMSSHGLFLR